MPEGIEFPADLRRDENCRGKPQDNLLLARTPLGALPRIAQRTARHLRDIPKPTQKTIPRSRPGAEPPTKSAQNCATPRNPVNLFHLRFISPWAPAPSPLPVPRP